MSLQLAIILVPVIFGLMGFALDLGRMYLIRGELNQAASAMAMAAAAQLNGTVASESSAQSAALALIDPSQPDSLTYNFGSLVVGQGSSGGFLTATTPSFSYYGSLAAAQSGNTTPDGTTAQYVSVNLAADAPLTFFALFPFGQSRKTSIAALATAGFSAPLCTACDIDLFAVAAITASDTTNFGFVPGNLYTFYFDCTGAPAPALLAGTTAPTVPYVLINGYNTNSSEAEDQQLFQTGAQGLLPSPYSSISQSCVAVNQAETLWGSGTSGTTVAGVTVTPGTCASGANAFVEDALCGLSARLTNVLPTVCTNNTDLANVSMQYSPDTDTAFYAAGDYTSYTGNNQRILTLAIMDGLTTLNVQCFRQFLLDPDMTPDAASDAINLAAARNGSFTAMYLGVVAPVKQGRFDGCSGITGPGKVVLQQ